jgi:PAS domain S-box-containing protein
MLRSGLFVCGWLLALCGALAALPRTVTVGVYNFPPLCHVPADGPETTAGAARSFFTPLLELVAQREEWRLTYVPGSRDECMQRLETGAVDLVMAAVYDRAPATAAVAFSREPLISSWAQIYTAVKGAGRSVTDIRGQVGIVRNDPYGPEVRALLARYNLKVNVVEFNDYAALLTALENKWIDAGAVDRIAPLHIPRVYRVHATPVSVAPVEFRFAVRRGANEPLLAALDYQVAQLKQDPQSLYYQLITSQFHPPAEKKLPPWVLWSGLGLCGLVMVAGSAGLVLRREVRRKTSELLVKNHELNEQIRQRQLADRALEKKTQLWKKTFISLRDSVLIIDGAQLMIIECNPAAAELFGCRPDELIGQALDILHPHPQKAELFYTVLKRALSGKGYLNGEFELKHRNGATFPAEVVVSLLDDTLQTGGAWVMIVRDISLRERLRKNELRLRQAQKMEAIGTLAGGIAHDFNNMLTPIIGYVDLLLRSPLANQPPAHEHLRQVQRAAGRAKDLVKQILTFSRHTEHKAQPTALGPIIQETAALLRATLPTSISIQCEVYPREDVVVTDAVHIQQILMNLGGNAAHAMREKGGRLEISLHDHQGPLPGCTHGGEPGPGPLLRLTVRDTGHGIEPVVLPRIFDPFFTTKAPGEGTGMGLAVVHGIVKNYHGAVSVESTHGTGTAFHVYLPKAPQQSIAPAAAPTPAVHMPGRGERVLVVDDEQLVVEMVEAVLGQAGYTVEIRTSSRDALVYFQAHPAAFDLVITDQTMPGLTGLELARSLLRLRPGQKIILCTGYSHALNAEKVKVSGIQGYLLKPFLPDDLTGLVHRVLHEDAGVQSSLV